MTVSNNQSKYIYNGNGTTGPWNYPRYFIQDADLLVTKTSASGVETPLASPADYTVTGAGLPAGGFVTTTAAVAVGEKITVSGNVDYVQGDSYPETGLLPAKTVERGLDRLTMMVQQINEKITRAFKLKISSTASEVTVDDPVEGNLLVWVSGRLSNVTAVATNLLTAFFQNASSNVSVGRPGSVTAGHKFDVNGNLWVQNIANINTSGDTTGSDSVNVYGQMDMYNPNSAIGAVGSTSVPGPSTSSSRGTGTAPTNSLTNDILGGMTVYGYIASAYGAAVAAIGRAVGATAANLGGQYEVWTKRDNGALTRALIIDNTQNAQFVGDVQGASFNGGQLAGFRNRIINGRFDIWQRGTSIAGTTGKQYSADRWIIGRAGGVAGTTVSRQTADSLSSLYAARVQRDSGNASTANVQFCYSLETIDSYALRNRNVTLSLKAKSGANFSSASSNLTARIVWGTGTDQDCFTGFTGQANVATLATAINTSSPTGISVSGTVPSNATQVGVIIEYTPVGTAGANDWFQVEEIQLEASPVATPFEQRPVSVERAMANWYFRRLGGVANYMLGNSHNQSATNWEVITRFTPMRTSPTVTLTSGTMGRINSGSATGVATLTMNAANIGNDSIYVNGTTAAVLTTGWGGIFYLNSSTDFVDLSSEL